MDTKECSVSIWDQCMLVRLQKNELHIVLKQKDAADVLHAYWLNLWGITSTLLGEEIILCSSVEHVIRLVFSRSVVWGVEINLTAVQSLLRLNEIIVNGTKMVIPLYYQIRNWNLENLHSLGIDLICILACHMIVL